MSESEYIRTNQGIAILGADGMYHIVVVVDGDMRYFRAPPESMTSESWNESFYDDMERELKRSE